MSHTLYPDRGFEIKHARLQKRKEQCLRNRKFAQIFGTGLDIYVYFGFFIIGVYLLGNLFNWNLP